MAKRKLQAEPLDEDGQEIRYVAIRLPIRELEDEGYQVSRSQLPRQLRNRNLTIDQGRALAMIRLGMLAENDHLDDQRQHLVTGARYRPGVASKEEVICRILEHVAHAIDQRGKS